MKSLPVLTNSHVSAWRSCPRLERLRYAEGYRPRATAGALSFGTAIHAALAIWLLSHDLLDALAVLSAIVDLYERARAEAMIVGYHHRWGASPLSMLGVEQPFRAPLRNPDTGRASKLWTVGGKLDGVVADEGARVFLMEHKTSSEDISPGSDYWVRLRLDSQASTYLAGARAIGIRPLGIIYDLLRKPDLEPRKATPVELRKYRKKDGGLYENQRETDETVDEYRDRILDTIAEAPEKYYQRAEVVRTEAEELEAARDLWEHAHAISEARKSGRSPRNPGACLSWGRSCEFVPICGGTEDLETSTRFRRLPPDTNEELES
jgi:hypothetical protein